MADILAGFAQGMMDGMRDSENRRFQQMELEARAKSADEQKQRQKYMDKFEMRKSGFKVPQGEVGEIDPADLEVDQDYLQARANSDPMAMAIKSMQFQGSKLDLDKKRVEASQAARGMKLAPDKVLQVQEGAQIPNQLNDIEETLKNNTDLFGPIAGRAGSMNPYDERAQTIDAQVRASAQAFGRYMEGGVLRKEDEDKYRKMFPQLNDTPEVAKNKLAIVRKLLVDKQNSNTKALSTQGYDTSAFQELPSAKNPGILKGGMMKDGLMAPGGNAAPDLAAKKARLEELRRKAAGQ